MKTVGQLDSCIALQSVDSPFQPAVVARERRDYLVQCRWTQLKLPETVEGSIERSYGIHPSSLRF